MLASRCVAAGATRMRRKPSSILISSTSPFSSFSSSSSSSLIFFSKSTLPFHQRSSNNTRFFSAITTTTTLPKEESTKDSRPILQAYNKLLTKNNPNSTSKVLGDPHQYLAIEYLDDLLEEILTNPQVKNQIFSGLTLTVQPKDGSSTSWLSNFFGSSTSKPKPSSSSSSSSTTSSSSPASKQTKSSGIYIHGGVGCGKTFCMNLFHSTLLSTFPNPTDVPIIQKVHFHAFMLSIHQRMHNIKQAGIRNKKPVTDVLPLVIDDIISKGKILCFDEFQVTDVADALILRRLFTGLIERGVIMVATSNRPPSDLYKNGLQRDLFVPFIRMIEETQHVVGMWDSTVDYRLIHGEIQARGVYFVGPDKTDFDKVFETLIGESEIASTNLRTQGRNVFVPKCNVEKHIARFNFWDLCGKALGASDFLTISNEFSTIFLEDVPIMEIKDMNVVRRFITLIDSLYEYEVKLVIHAAARPEGLFKVDHGSVYDEVFAFDRTRSRLDEMMSEEWLKRKRKHVPAAK